MSGLKQLTNGNHFRYSGCEWRSYNGYSPVVDLSKVIILCCKTENKHTTAMYMVHAHTCEICASIELGVGCVEPQSGLSTIRSEDQRQHFSC